MKILKLDHQSAHLILTGQKHSTWRLFDDKDLRVGDEVELVDKVDPADKGSWQIIGVAVITRIVETQLGAIADTETVNHEAFDSRAALLKTYQGYYGSEVTFETPVKVLTFDFTPIQTATSFMQTAAPVSSSTQWRELKLFGDGGSRGNPGPSASGYVLLDMHDHKLVDEGVYLGITTNNQAEYLSLKYGMEDALKRGARILHVHMDSLLVINQMKGIFKVKNRDLWAVHQTIKDMLPRFEKVTFTHVPREYNRLADAAVNRTLDTESGPKHAAA